MSTTEQRRRRREADAAEKRRQEAAAEAEAAKRAREEVFETGDATHDLEARTIPVDMGAVNEAALATAVGAQVEVLSPKAGDVVVVRSQDAAFAADYARAVGDALRANGVAGVTVVGLAAGESLEVVDEADMLALGWQRGGATRIMTPAMLAAR